MKPSFHEASARQNSGGPSPVPGRGGDRENQPRSAASRQGPAGPGTQRAVVKLATVLEVDPAALRRFLAARSRAAMVGRERVHLLMNQRFADSPLEETRFEPSVPLA